MWQNVCAECELWSAHAVPQRDQTLQLWGLWEELFVERWLPSAPKNPFRVQALHVCWLRQGVLRHWQLQQPPQSSHRWAPPRLLRVWQRLFSQRFTEQAHDHPLTCENVCLHPVWPRVQALGESEQALPPYSWSSQTTQAWWMPEAESSCHQATKESACQRLKVREVVCWISFLLSCSIIWLNRYYQNCYYDACI